MKTTEDFIKNTPFLEQIEQNVLGCLMLKPECLDEIAGITEKDFYLLKHKVIFTAIITQIKEGKLLDIISLTDNLLKKNQLEEAGGEIYLFEIARNVWTVGAIKHYASLLKKASMDRELLRIAQEIISGVYEKEENTLDATQQKLISLLNNESQDVRFIGSALPAIWQEIDERCKNPGMLEGLSTGFFDLDKITHGLQKGELIIVGARPSMGKTAFVMNIAEHVSIDLHKTVMFFSIEMNIRSIVKRSIASRTGIDAEKFKTGNLTENDFSKFAKINDDFNHAKLVIDDSSSMTLADMRSKCRNLQKSHGLDLIIVDYLTILKSEKAENQTLKIAALSSGLKAIAKDFDVPIIVLSQLNRNVESRQDKRPMLSDLRDSGGIEQDGDVIMFIYRDEVCNDKTEYPGTAEIIIAKHRNGATGKVILSYNKNIVRFSNYTGRQYIIEPYRKKESWHDRAYQD